ncbi:tripartite tricarboxylate transporter TctB family protein [Rhodococcus opacus]|uniref:tripartite tricarboxylate transporter TctB family protein n=1 Tax=Rhodococcus opacus TaxID=37919 RepID=UPI00146C6641|nr:tripartite tricarboxylate transporter TctB family protein [Rhodococcus opacus]MDJ0420078.1 tripartite tricarboxylate transporter TctB family protein [Rhodococcus opacus]MDV7089081.1 tripartite tricarboxylate transporter TctB family protein [Rhodococcus opacus]UNN04608.1 tripartite tricarboxylate transporter TctB family protein [Rhodococcus opacus]WKN52407.1 tripartite tricarboxylate transporter TctB family protein [Rhodococcus opacus]
MSDTLLVEESAEKNQRAVEKSRLTPAVLTVLGVLATIESVRLGLGDLTEPGPGAWPLLTSVGVLVTSAWLFITGVERCEKAMLSDLARVATAIASVAFFVVMLPLVGMPVPAFVLLVVWLRLFGESWRLTLVTAALGVVALQIVFVELLGVPFPIGPLAPGR